MINNNLNAPQTIELARYTPFTTRNGDTTFTFYTQQTYLAYRDGNQYSFNGVEIKEGVPIRNTFVWGIGTTITIPNSGVDTSTLRVTVQESAQSSAFEVYKQASTFVDVDGNSLVYFIKEIDGGLYQIEFGNGVVGKALDVGNVIAIEYMVTNADAANGARSFQYTGGAVNDTQIFTTTTDPAFGGAPAESIESIKWNAPRAYAAQNRCVTVDDYKSIIYRLYPNAHSINVWGGEQNTPPSYGDVFISIRPASGEMLSDAEKEYILNEIIGPRKVVTVHPKFVDPTHLYVELSTAFYYNENNTNRSATDIAALVAASIKNYSDTQLNKFSGVMKYSQLSRAIESSEESIVSSITTIKLHRVVTPVFNRPLQYIIDIGNPIYNSGVPEQSVVSTGIRVLNVPQTVYLDDIPNPDSDTGVLRMFYYSGGKKVAVKNVGTVVYSKGLITIDSLTITGISDVDFRLIIKPQSNDIVSVRNDIITIPPDLVTITPVIDAVGDKYSFTSSRN
jgi:hypothetical protein